MAIDRLQPAPIVKLFVAVMGDSTSYQTDVEEEMIATFGPIERRSETYVFSEFSPYYDREFSSRVWKYLVSFRRTVAADELVSAKLTTESLEQKYATSSSGKLRRTVNLDPGYVTGWSVVLSTVKNHSHRIYLGSGIFGEVTLLFRNQVFQQLPWTYPDYRSPNVLEFLERVRQDWLAESDR